MSDFSKKEKSTFILNFERVQFLPSQYRNMQKMVDQEQSDFNVVFTKSLCELKLQEMLIILLSELILVSNHRDLRKSFRLRLNCWFHGPSIISAASNVVF